MFKLTPYNRSVVRRNRGQQSLSDLVDDFFGDDFFPMRSLRHDTFKIDVKENDNEFIIEADVPGINKEEIKIDYQDGLMTISINHEESKEETTETYVHRERNRSSMSRSLNLGDLDIDKIDAKLENGILTIIAPKSEIIENKKLIEIK